MHAMLVADGVPLGYLVPRVSGVMLSQSQWWGWLTCPVVPWLARACRRIRGVVVESYMLYNGSDVHNDLYYTSSCMSCVCTCVCVNVYVELCVSWCALSSHHSS